MTGASDGPQDKLRGEQGVLPREGGEGVRGALREGKLPLSLLAMEA